MDAEVCFHKMSFLKRVHSLHEYLLIQITANGNKYRYLITILTGDSKCSMKTLYPYIMACILLLKSESYSS